MILVTGATGNAGSAVARALARGAGVERVVLLSNASAPSGDTSNAITRYHIESEVAVRKSGLNWSFLLPRTFMTNTLQWAPQIRSGDVVRAPFGGVRVATIHPDDLGAVAAAALTGEGHAGKAYPLTGRSRCCRASGWRSSLRSSEAT